MKLIGKEKFLKYKKSDTLVIWGSGSSIKNLTEKDFAYLNQFDSISTTAFSHSKIQTTFYIIGEILFNYYRAKTNNQICDGSLLYKLYENAGDSPLKYVNTFKDYTNTCFIIWDDKWSLHKDHFNELDKLPNDYILVNQFGHDPNLYNSGLKIDNDTGPNNKFVDKNLYDITLLLDKKIWLHPWKGINAPIYFAKCMDYKKVIFVGVDLTAGSNSYGYDRNKFVETIASKIHKNHKAGTVHPCKELLFKFINYLKDDIIFTTYTPSLLEEIIKIDINKKPINKTDLSKEEFYENIQNKCTNLNISKKIIKGYLTNMTDWCLWFKNNPNKEEKFYEMYFNEILKNNNVIDGLWLEFGVWTGKTINILSKYTDKITGFDSFEGLPDPKIDGRSNWKQSYFNRRKILPSVNDNVELVVGWFDETLLKWKETNKKKIAVMHIDSDLYSSAKYILNNLKDLLDNGTIVMFDELINYADFKTGEFLALYEFCKENKEFSFKPLYVWDNVADYNDVDFSKKSDVTRTGLPIRPFYSQKCSFVIEKCY